MPFAHERHERQGGSARCPVYPHSLIVLEIDDCETVYRELAVRGVESSAR